MAAGKRVRWDCPHGLHAGVLGSTRPPRDSIVRFCLECSAESGRLVERTAPALERKRTQKREQAVARKASKAEREKAAALARRSVEVFEVDGSIARIDMDAALAKMCKLPEVAERWRESWPGRTMKGITLNVLHGASYGTSGHAQPYSEHIAITVGRGETRQRVEEVLLHELVHLACTGDTWHGAAFRSSLLRAAKQWWPGIEVRNEGRVYGMDDRIVAEAVRLAKEAS